MGRGRVRALMSIALMAFDDDYISKFSLLIKIQ